MLIEGIFGREVAVTGGTIVGHCCETWYDDEFVSVGGGGREAKDVALSRVTGGSWLLYIVSPNSRPSFVLMQETNITEITVARRPRQGSMHLFWIHEAAPAV